MKAEREVWMEVGRERVRARERIERKRERLGRKKYYIFYVYFIKQTLGEQISAVFAKYLS